MYIFIQGVNMIIDTHIHLYDERYRDDLDAVIRRAIDNDVGKMIIVGYDRESSIQAVAMAECYDFMYAAVGVHPSEVHKEPDKNLTWIFALLSRKKP
jgi:TatD DNase family protein